MHTYRFRCPRRTLSAGDVRALRTVSSLSIAELQRHAAQGEPIIELPPVPNRSTLETLCSAIESGTLPLDIYEFSDFPGLALSDQKLSPPELRVRLQSLRRGETETELSIDVEQGEITTEEYHERLNELDRNA
jgi:hypothetical protein